MRKLHTHNLFFVMCILKTTKVHSYLQQGCNSSLSYTKPVAKAVDFSIENCAAKKKNNLFQKCVKSFDIDSSLEKARYRLCVFVKPRSLSTKCLNEYILIMNSTRLRNVPISTCSKHKPIKVCKQDHKLLTVEINSRNLCDIHQNLELELAVSPKPGTYKMCSTYSMSLTSGSYVTFNSSYLQLYKGTSTCALTIRPLPKVDGKYSYYSYKLCVEFLKFNIPDRNLLLKIATKNQIWSFHNGLPPNTEEMCGGKFFTNESSYKVSIQTKEGFINNISYAFLFRYRFVEFLSRRELDNIAIEEDSSDGLDLKAKLFIAFGVVVVIGALARLLLYRYKSKICCEESEHHSVAGETEQCEMEENFQVVSRASFATYAHQTVTFRDINSGDQPPCRHLVDSRSPPPQYSEVVDGLPPITLAQSDQEDQVPRSPPPPSYESLFQT